MHHSWTRRASIIALFGAGALSLPAAARETHASDFGVLVMAHGGGDAWNASVEAMLAPLRSDHPLEIAFGMADPASLQAGVSRLEARGARRIAVVRLFISGEAGLSARSRFWACAPALRHGRRTILTPVMAGTAWRCGGSTPPPASRRASKAWRRPPEMGPVLARRALAQSRDLGTESILIVAHGPEDDAENRRWLAHIDARAQSVRQAAPFRSVQVETLREDWPERRAASEARIRAFVEAAAQEGGRAIVLPFRVQGFGPYAETLAGLTYVADGQGLLPSQEVEAWARRQAMELRAGRFRRPARLHGQ